jgi:hypothetical protein
VIKKPRKNEEAKARYRAVENTITMGSNARKTNKQTNKQVMCGREISLLTGFSLKVWSLHII